MEAVLGEAASLLRDGLGFALLLAGGFFYLVGAIGLIRMPDLFTRMHAASVSETLGVGLLIAGLIVQAGLTLITVKLVVILLLILLTSPIASHALARAALYDGARPLLTDAQGNLTPTDVVTQFPELGERLNSRDDAGLPEPDSPSDTQGGAPSNSS